MRRESLRRCEDEEDLVAQQETFIASKKLSSAKVTRIQRGSVSSYTAPSTSDSSIVAPSVSDNNIVGEVFEKQIATPAFTPAVSLHAFPEPQHRRQSKFSLARKAASSSAAAKPKTNNTEWSPDDTDCHYAKAASSTSNVENSAIAAHKLPARAEPPVGAALTTLPEAAGVQQENEQRLNALSAEQVDEALQELQARFSPQTLDFLRQRGQQAGAQAAATSGVQLAEAPAATRTQEGRALEAGGRRTRQSPSTAAGGAPNMASLPGTHTAAGSRAAGRGGRGLAAGDAAADAAAGDAEYRLVARVRWGLEGQVVGLATPHEEQFSEQVVSRDPLRQSEGAAADGYTVGELCLLTRSSSHRQRAAALHMLAALLAAARPTFQDVTACGHLLPRPVPIPAEVYDSSEGPNNVLDWSEVWDLLVSELGVALLLHAALQDSSPAVVAAAAEALAALLCPGVAEEALLQAADLSPCCSGPAVRPTALRRDTPQGTWEAAADTGQELPGERSEDEDLEAVARDDPLEGLARLQLLPLLCRLLQPGGRPPRALLPLLKVMIAMARSSPSIAENMARNRPLLLLLQDLLTALPLETADGSAAATATAQVAARPWALMLIRTMCQSSVTAARLLRTAGTFAGLHSYLLPSTSPTAGPPHPHAAALLLEVLRTWRVCALQGVPFAHVDDAYAALCALLQPCAAVSERHWRPLPCTTWALVTEAFLLLETLVVHAVRVEGGDATIGKAMISPGCAAALAAEAVAWLQAQHLLPLARQAADASDNLGPAVPLPASLHMHMAAHPCCNLPAGPAALMALAAVLQFCASYCSTLQRSHPDRAALAQQLQAAGLDALPHGASTCPDLGTALVRVAGGHDAQVLGRSLLRQALQLVSLHSPPQPPATPFQLAAGAALLCAATSAADASNTAATSSATPLLLLPALQPLGDHLLLLSSKSRHPPTALHPWAAAALQARMPLLGLARALLLSMKPHLPTILSNGSASSLASPLPVAVGVLSLALCIPALAPPGAEELCLVALSVGLLPEVLQLLLPHAEAAMREVAPPSLATAAAGSSTSREPAGYALHSCPSAAAVSRQLLHSYAASWLSLLSLQQLDAFKDSSSALAALPQLHKAVLPQAQGSRLPTPPVWFLLEALTLPAPQEHEGGDAAADAPPVACALLIAVALARARSSVERASTGAVGVDPADMLKAALQLVYLFNAGELLQQGQELAGDAGELLWQQPLVRWPLAALTATCVAAGVADGCPQLLLPRNWMDRSTAEKLARTYAATCMGDPLFGQHVALLLSRSCPPAVQQGVWQLLAEGCCLQLLPPLHSCLGSLQDYVSEAEEEDGTELVSQVANLMVSPAWERVQDSQAAPAALAAALLAVYLVHACTSMEMSPALRQKPFSLLRTLLRAAADSTLAAVGTELQKLMDGMTLRMALQEGCCGDTALSSRLSSLVLFDY